MSSYDKDVCRILIFDCKPSHFSSDCCKFYMYLTIHQSFTDQNGSGEPPPYTEQTEYPPLYTVDDTGTPRNLRTGDPDAATHQEQNDTIAYSPPPPYTVLPPRLLLTRESIARSSVNTIASLNHIGPETNSIANTPLLQHAPTTRLFTALENIRNPSARGSSGRHVNSAHSSISAGLRQPVHVTPNTLRRASRAQQSRQQATISNANSYSGTERR